MLTDKIQKISDETQQIKQEIADAITAQVPTQKELYFTIKFNELEDCILSAAYYNVNYQLRQLIEYVTENSTRSLSAILNTFQSIAKTGKATAFRDLYFNNTTRSVIRSLL